MPANENTTVTIYASDITEWGEYADDTSMPLHVGLPGEPVVVLCNLSEIYSNVLITVTDGDETLEFHPMLSMEDGHLAETPGVYDFSIYLDIPDEATVQLAMERLMQMEEVRAAMQQGMVLLNTDIVQRISGHNCLLTKIIMSAKSFLRYPTSSYSFMTPYMTYGIPIGADRPQGIRRFLPQPLF